MPQVRESCCCGIFAFFFQCCFMIETQVLMTVSDFLGFFSRNHFVERGFTFQWEDLFFRRVASFLSVCGRCHMGALVLMEGGGFKTNCRMGASPAPPMGNPASDKSFLKQMLFHSLQC